MADPQAADVVLVLAVVGVKVVLAVGEAGGAKVFAVALTAPEKGPGRIRIRQHARTTIVRKAMIRRWPVLVGYLHLECYCPYC